ncbi:hypothetical protein [Glycomyces arizonensis]|uniref:hypothetical protein n=1 Tax=Glycomyces arizonensis TaxID=256035 RepID=UPI00047C03B3|nr:hypothetical protein [Glycomyces arizonensis]
MFMFDDAARADARPPVDKVEAAIKKETPKTFREPSTMLQAAPGEGILSIAVDAEETAPVIAIDGRPAAAGIGQLDLALPVGEHLIEVQGTHTADPVVVRVGQNEVQKIGYHQDPLTGRNAFGDFPESLERVGDGSGCLVWTVQAAALVGVLWILVAVFSQRNYAVAVVVAVATALVAVLCLPLSRKAKRSYWRKRAEQLQLPARAAEPYPWGADGETDALLCGAADPAVPTGQAAIDLDLECARHLRIGRRKARSGAFLARAWTRRPHVAIDGVVQSATWGRWRYQVAPGPHRVAVTVDGRPLNLTIPAQHDGEVAECSEIEVTAVPGTATAIRAEAQVSAHWNARTGHVESRPPTLRLETARAPSALPMRTRRTGVHYRVAFADGSTRGPRSRVQRTG